MTESLALDDPTPTDDPTPVDKPLPRLRVVNTTGVGFKTKIYIDDEDVSACFNNVQVTAGLKDSVMVQLDALVCEIEIDNAQVLEMPAEGTRELLIKHGWTPPVEPVIVPAATTVTRTHRYEPLDSELFNYGEAVSGRELVNRLMERVEQDWEPSDSDTLTVERVYDEDGLPIPGKRSYSLTL